ncbi:hypothetical protein AWB67_03937 [Caballeronia terrestris]|uniref:Uncharacterized protein n=1 Tax=Caballeronia terrestris TaxID=1226301 RepID=A0A158JM32_9BURK|nr:hypothetical protein AWB67_03937 [Caballeronia terrestris]
MVVICKDLFPSKLTCTAWRHPLSHGYLSLAGVDEGTVSTAIRALTIVPPPPMTIFKSSSTPLGYLMVMVPVQLEFTV